MIACGFELLHLNLLAVWILRRQMNCLLSVFHLLRHLVYRPRRTTLYSCRRKMSVSKQITSYCPCVALAKPLKGFVSSWSISEISNSTSTRDKRNDQGKPNQCERYILVISLHHQSSITRHGDVSQGAAHTAWGIQKHLHLYMVYGCIKIPFN